MGIGDRQSTKDLAQYLERRLRHQELMSELARSFISEKETMAELIGKSLQLTGEHLRVQRILISSVNTETGVSRVDYLWQVSDGMATLPEATGIKDLIMGMFPHDAPRRSTVPTIYCNDVASDRRFSLLLPLGVKAVVWAPIYVDNRYWGILSIEDCNAPRVWSPNESEIVSLISHIIASAVARDQRHKKLVRMSSIVENSPQFICHINGSNVIEYVNKAACSVFGYSFDDLLGNKLDVFLDGETAAHVENDCIPLVRRSGKQEFLLPMKGADGQVHFMRLSMFVIRALAGGMGIIGIDETEKTLIEHERVEALEQAKRASQAKSDFLANMSHEMRTPMNAIIGMTSIAKSTDDPDRKDYCLRKIEDASNHLLGVINDILDMSKIEANKFELSPVKFNFDKMLQKIVNVINFRVDEKKLKLSVHVDSHIPTWLIGDDQRLSQVIANLMSNAVKFTPEGGNIRLDSHLEDETDGTCTIKTDVRDDGIGITQEQKGRLFASFEQAESGTSRKFGGTGLGLAISKRIVEMMGGRIWVESEPGVGSTFSFTIRVEGTNEETGTMLGSIQRENLRVMVVDDDSDLLEYFVDIASRLGIKCDMAISGEEALRLVSERKYDIYFIDWNMPVMNGIELARRIKGMDSGYSVVIMISSTEWQVIADDAKKAGVDRFMPKPIFISAVADCINECIGTAAAAAESRSCATEESDFEGYTILLAEDVEVNREILLTLLEPTKIAIDCAENGQEAVDMFRANPTLYDMIFMDVQMPMMDGYNATRQIRASGLPRAHDITIVAMTANVFREDVERCLASGMNDHVGKPLDLSDVINKLCKYLPEHPVSQMNGDGLT